MQRVEAFASREYALSDMIGIRGLILGQVIAFLIVGCYAVPGLAFPPSDLLAALPAADDGGSMLGCRTSGGSVGFIVERTICTYVSVRGAVATDGKPGLAVRLRSPLDLSPVFFAVDLGTEGIGGRMTLLLGPVSVDLGRQFVVQSRWAVVQMAVSPWMTWILHWKEQQGAAWPSVGWRISLGRHRHREAGLLVGRGVTGWMAWEF